jgi:hypothetical protein
MKMKEIDQSMRICFMTAYELYQDGFSQGDSIVFCVPLTQILLHMIN